MAKNNKKPDSCRICKNCVMDNTDPQIRFNKSGVCNHCTGYDEFVKYPPLENVLDEIKKKGEGKEYNCVIGVSGGVDSTYLAYVVKKQFGLKPIAVHLDNGWNSKLAVKNIQNIVNKLNIDLHTHVINWEEFKDLQLAYLQASVIDIEALTDHAISASLYEVAGKHDIKFILSGNNNATERILPRSWSFNKNDIANILSIHKKYGTIPLKTFPVLGSAKLSYYTKTKKIKLFEPLNYIAYNKKDAKETIVKELAWEDYGGKHYESVFTRFYQGYILPRKFNIDKRKAHFSTLICSGQMTREEALEELKTHAYGNEEQMKNDYDYVIKKFDLTKEQFERIMNMPVRSHFDFDTDFRSKILRKLLSPTNPLLKIARIIKNAVK